MITKSLKKKNDGYAFSNLLQILFQSNEFQIFNVMCIIKALQMLFILRGKRDLVVLEIRTYIGIPYYMDRTFFEINCLHFYNS